MMTESTPSRENAATRSAHRVVAAVRENLGRKDDDDKIETNVRSLRNLTSIIENLIEEVQAARASANSCGDCMGGLIDGVRLWVLSDRFEDLKKSAEETAVRAEKYEDYLRTISAISLDDQPEVSIFADWRGVAFKMQAIAENALQSGERKN